MSFWKKEKLPYSFTNIKTEGKPIEMAPFPHKVKISLLSAKNLLGVPLVKPGQIVVEGEAIGQVEDFFFYASISGKVVSITKEEVRIGSAKIISVPVIEIDFAGKIINWHKEKFDYFNRSVKDLKDQIIRLGVENLDPTSCLSMKDILNFPEGAHLLVSSLEISPMVNFPTELLLQKEEEIQTALSILEYILKPKETTLIVTEELKDKYFSSQRNIAFMNPHYPNSYTSSIFKYFTGIDTISPEILKKELYVIIDTQTLFHLYHAVVYNKPFLEQLITIDGKIAKNPAHYFVKLGSNIKETLLDIGIYETPSKVLNGNIFNADIVYSLDKNINASMYSLILLDEPIHPYHKFEECIQCNQCHVFCPVDLYPYDIVHSLKKEEEALSKCIDCGICSYICPSNIPLGYFLEIKKQENL